MKEKGLMLKLHNLGFTLNGIVEVILVTRGADGSMNAAPMGVMLVEDFLELRPYKSSQTYMNLRLGGEAAINICNDPYFFLATAFKEEVPHQPQVCSDMSLLDADSCIYVNVQGETSLSETQAVFKAKPIKLIIKRKHTIVFSRGRAEAIEAVIHTTRVKALQQQRKISEVRTLTEKIAQCAEIVWRVSPEGSSENRTISELYRIMADWGVQA